MKMPICQVLLAFSYLLAEKFSYSAEHKEKLENLRVHFSYTVTVEVKMPRKRNTRAQKVRAKPELKDTDENKNGLSAKARTERLRSYLQDFDVQGLWYFCCLCEWMLGMLVIILANAILKYVLSYFSQKIKFDISCRLFTLGNLGDSLHGISNPIFWEQ